MAVMTLAGAYLGSAGTAHAQDAPGQVGAPWTLPASSPSGQDLAVLGALPAGDAVQAAESAAAARARATGVAQVVGSLTTGTTLVTAQPDGRLTTSLNVLPVRTRLGGRWVPVNTRLVRLADGRFAPAAVPGDAVSFSGGGSGAMAVITALGTRLALWWPGRLPVPAVSGSSATYRGVLPGVNLVLTATSVAAGGFSEVLVVTSRAATADRGLAGLSLRVMTSGTTGLRGTGDGGLVARMTGGRGWYQAPAAMMWDSSSVTRSARKSVLRAAASSARAVGAGLAGSGIGAVSTTAGPAFGARLASVGTRVLPGGHELSLVPDVRMLSSATTRYPAYIDPGFTTITNTGGEQAYDPVQSDAGTGACSSTTCDKTDCRGSHYDDSSYSSLPVGYDDFEYAACEFSDTDYALYRVAIPPGMFGSHAVLISASLQTAEDYTSSCSASASVTASWIGAIGSGTGWPGPGVTKADMDATDTIGADSGSCNTTLDTSKTVSAGFNLKPDLAKFSGAASNITVRLWEKGNTNDVDHKQFTRNPSLQVTWTDTPNTPKDMKEAASNSGTNGLDCATSPSSAPHMGKTDSTNGPSLIATYGDTDGATVQANIRYENYTSSPGTWTEKDAAIDNLTTANGEQGWELPASYTSAMADGTIVGWQAQSETGSGSVDGTTYGPYKSAWTSTCYFAVYPNSPDEPALTTGFTQGTAQPVGSQVSFTIAQSSGDTAGEFVWGLDATPPTTGSIPAAQTCTTTAATASCTKIISGSATLTISVPSPGPHDLWVYEVDAGGNDSGMTNGAAADTTWTFSGAGDPSVSYMSGSSLQANFTAALTDPSHSSYDNTMISKASGSPGGADGDGNGDSLDAAQLTAAGWSAGKTVTVDGASFTLPSFGTSASGPDNLLAARQTIGTGSSGARGSALVFLATSTNGLTQVGGLASGSPDSGSLDSEVTAPAVMGGTAVTGSGCTNVVGFNTNMSCDPASGSISYASGCAAGATVSYTLTVPNWVIGPSDIAAVITPDRDTPSGQQADSPKIFAFAVPLDASCAVTSVTLPDVSATVDTTVTTGITQHVSALHIFGMSLRNTTTATPEASGAAPASPAAQAWTGAFESPVEDAYAPPSGTTWGNQTIRIWASPNISAPAGAQIRIRLSDPGVLSADGTGPLSIGAATIAQQYYGAVPAQTPVALTFGGSGSVTVPEGGDIYSDPLTLPFAVTAGQNLLISLWLKNASVPDLPLNAFGSGAGAWFAPGSTPNETGDTAGTPFTGTGSSSYGAVPLLTGIDVTTSEVSSGGVVTSPGEPTAVVAGNNVIDGFSSQAVSDTLNYPSQRLAGQLASQGLAAGNGVVDAGVQSNQVLADGTSGGGLSLLARADRDILAEPDTGTVILDEGLEDILRDSSSATLEADLEHAYTLLENQLLGWGINVITTDPTPCWGYSNTTAGDSCSATADADRMDIGDYIDTGGGAPNCPARFDDATGNAATPDEALASGNGTSDDVNLTLGSSGGYAKLAPAAAGCGFQPALYSLPPTS